MTEEQFLPQASTQILSGAPITVEAPSNIALIKYWGKRKEQLPKNPSISLTLDHCRTTTILRYKKRENPISSTYDFSVFLDGKAAPGFEPKIRQFFGRIEPYVPFINQFRFDIATSNSFPHSSGIASSASGMSALAVGIMQLERDMRPEMSVDYFRKKASFLARLGSGSASRSIEGPIVIWGRHEGVEESSDLYGIRYKAAVSPIFDQYQDTILLVDRGEKQVSSTVGHNLMNDHPYADGRFEQANERMILLLDIMEKGDLNAFMHLVESEALTLHAMMLTSSPYYILMKPNTLNIVNKIWEYRRETEIPVCFTLDAGSNVHMLYPKNTKDQVLQFIKDELVMFCQNGQYICDQAGNGAQIMK